jgi:hypothetical protein
MSDPKFHMSKLFSLSTLDLPCSNLVTPFKSSLPATNSPQSPKLPLTPFLKILPLLVTSRALSAHLPTPLLTSPLHQFLLLPHLPMAQNPPAPTPAGSPKHLPPYFPSTVVTIGPEPLAPQGPTPPTFPSALATPSPFSSPPPSHTCSHTSSQARLAHLYHSGRWQELMALSEFMCPFP